MTQYYCGGENTCLQPKQEVPIINLLVYTCPFHSPPSKKMPNAIKIWLGWINISVNDQHSDRGEDKDFFSPFRLRTPKSQMLVPQSTSVLSAQGTTTKNIISVRKVTKQPILGGTSGRVGAGTKSRI